MKDENKDISVYPARTAIYPNLWEYIAWKWFYCSALDEDETGIVVLCKIDSQWSLGTGSEQDFETV